MKQTTIYLPDDLKKRLEPVAHQERRTEAAIVREALADALNRREVAPTVPLFAEESKRQFPGRFVGNPGRPPPPTETAVFGDASCQRLRMVDIATA